jgi:DNA-binding MarR family transcriptional regulator
MPIDGLDPVVHHPVRLGILTVLANVDQAAFSYLKQALELTDGNLSRNLSTLEAAGHLASTKGYEGRRPRTWLRITQTGRDALEAEITTLRAMQSWRPPSED